MPTNRWGTQFKKGDKVTWTTVGGATFYGVYMKLAPPSDFSRAYGRQAIVDVGNASNLGDGLPMEVGLDDVRKVDLRALPPFERLKVALEFHSMARERALPSPLMARECATAGEVYEALYDWAHKYNKDMSMAHANAMHSLQSRLDAAVHSIAAREGGAGRRVSTRYIEARRLFGFWFASDVRKLPTMTPSYILSCVDEAPVSWAAASLYLDAKARSESPLT